MTDWQAAELTRGMKWIAIALVIAFTKGLPLTQALALLRDTGK